MEQDLLLGIDVGTTQVKVAAFGTNGELAASASARYPLTTDQETNAAEQDPTDWWSATAEAVRNVAQAVDPAGVLAACVGGQGPTLVALDGKGEPVAPAMTWMDLRAGREAEILSERIGRNLPAYFFTPKAMWLSKNRTSVYRDTHSFCQAWDFVASRMTGELKVSSSPGIAPWSGELLEAAELDQGKFPGLSAMGEPVGRLTAEASKLTGLPEDLPVIGGISDFFEGLIGSGALSKGVACDNGGTSQGFSVCWDAPLDDQSILSVPSFVEGDWYIGGPVSTTGKALQWWLESVLGCAPGDFTLLEGISQVPAGSARLLFLPYLSGERAPIWDAQARGVFFGLSLNHGRKHLTRAVLESVAFTLTHLIERIELAGGQVSEIRACGGQAKSEAWCQIKADVTGKPVVLPMVTDAPVLGAAILAGVGVKAFPSIEAGAENMARAQAVIQPAMEHRERYQSMFALYKELYQEVQPLYGRLREVQ